MLNFGHGVPKIEQPPPAAAPVWDQFSEPETDDQ
jgi:hypothetical protein